MALTENKGGTRRYTIREGAWTRGDQLRDLEVVVTLKAGAGAREYVSHVSFSHRSVTPAALEQVQAIVRKLWPAS